jgi:ribonuclease HI
MDREVEVYTDGGCHGNPGPGGWAFVVRRGDDVVSKNGFERLTTNNRMELIAVISALEYLKSSGTTTQKPIAIHTDSQYVKRGITEWIARWVANGWRTSGKKAVKNRDLWEYLLKLSAEFSIEWKWVRGHDGVELNEECDRLVQEAINTAEK